ncbi:putative late blight resistance proteinR1B-8 [Sesamum alatum]|uniref:Late blight resistance proteinR1B-8 n=1 Tax=Sesamum alatum TaxID=300844 RepID=A0AAE2CM88_9LAMI|nr:putative late blight resistance proteinR1B-8 [Sesamum alatum]
MATAYAALVSLVQTIEQIQHHPRPPISLDRRQVHSLQENVAFLQDFLEHYSQRLITQEYEDYGLVVRIADAAHAAEDVIENHIVDQILDQPTTSKWDSISSIDYLYQHLQKVIEDMDLIKREVIAIKEKMGLVQDQLHRNSVPADSLSSSPLTGYKQAMVGVDDVLIDIMDKLTGQQSGCLIVPIVGMGGIGKTTLARNVYENPLIVQYFDTCAWVTVSQEYNTRQILLELVGRESKESKDILSEEELGAMLYRSLSGRRYLIVMDDIWSIEAWDKVKLFFPNNNGESRIVITTRLSNLALQISGSCGLTMNFLKENKSWDLFCKTVFGEEGSCPLELEEIGKTIAKNCKGLPLSLIVIGGLLAKSEKTRDYWKYIAENLSSILNLEDNHRCLRILYMSYRELPIHLKPCFLYMGVFPEDKATYVSRLRKLWVAERFLKPISGKTLEEVAGEYLKDLIDRNLIIVHRLGSSGKIRSCKMHDLLRDLGLREARKEKFLCSLEIGQAITIHRRIVVHQNSLMEKYDTSEVLHSAQLPRSLTCDFQEALPLASFRLLRVLQQTYAEDLHYLRRKQWYPIEAIFKLVNLQYLAFSAGMNLSYSFPSSMHLLWNLQPLIVKRIDGRPIYAPPEIWKMHQLRHLQVPGLGLPDPPTATATGDDFVLPNLRKMSQIKNFKCSEAVVERIPNIRKLHIFYSESSISQYCPENLAYLHKLESLYMSLISEVTRSDLESLSFPHSLKKLTLWGGGLRWKHINAKIGSLPLLQVLKLYNDSVKGGNWNTVEGQFCSLRFLQMTGIYELRHWRVESSHFPCLNRLRLVELRKLRKIPSSFGEIQTLEVIELYMCRDSVVVSAKEIAEQQEEFGNQDFRVEVFVEPNSELKSLASHNFQVFSSGFYYQRHPAWTLCKRKSFKTGREIIDACGDSILSREQEWAKPVVEASNREAYLRLSLTLLAAFVRLSQIAATDDMLTKLPLILEFCLYGKLTLRGSRLQWEDITRKIVKRSFWFQFHSTLLKENIETLEMAAAAYAALVSLVHTIEQIQHHPRPPISLDENQVQSLHEMVAFLQDFLEPYASQEYEDGLLIRIADAAHAAEDVIENHIVDQILDQSKSTTQGGNMSSIDHFYQDLQKVIADMDLIKREVIMIKEKMGLIQDQLHRNSVPAGSLSASPLTGQKQAMVGVDDVLNNIMDKLTGQQSGCRIIPIVGMGGIGKTTLRNVYENPLIVEYFDIRTWVTVSREYNTREILLKLVCPKGKESMEILSEEELSRRYLIILDDMWSIETWDNVKLFFPNNNNESKIIITTRLSNLALQISGSRGLRMNFLDENKSWELFCKIVFREVGNCPLELEEIGKTVARNCKGLPLSLIVIGGLLAKSEKTQGYWKYIAENLSSIVNLEDDKRCLRILYTSYQELPIHLKPCFLYMGVFPEDSMTHVSRLRKLWVAEGFLKPISGKSLEEVAEEYLKDLIDRNLIIPLMMGSTEKIKICSMHDLLRDLCLREAHKEKFLCSLELGQSITIQRRVVVHQSSSKDKYDLRRALHSAKVARSLTCDFQEALPLASFRLLRVLKKTYSEDIFDLRREDGYLTEAIFKLVNSRYLALGANACFGRGFPSSMHLLWNLQTLIFQVAGYQIIDAPPEIWKMHQLKQVDVNVLHLPDPPFTTRDELVLPNLQKLSQIVNFKCCEAVVKRIPSIKKLRICYNDFYSLLYCIKNLGHTDISSLHYCLENLGRLQKLESLHFSLSSRLRRSELAESMSFPCSLKKLTLWGCRLQWEDMTTKIGSEWETVEGEFCSLRVLEIIDIDDLEYWTVESGHFPCLHHLCLRNLRKLKKIPSSFGEIQTLELIELNMCSNSTVISVKEIAEQQEELGNEDLLIILRLEPESELEPELKSLASLRFRVF